MPTIFPLITTYSLYILFSNLLGLIPGFMSPTANINVTMGLTLITIIYYHYLGLKYKGLAYFKDFLGPMPWLIPLMLPAEIFSHLGRLLSLSFRLFGNLLSKEILLGILTMLGGKFLLLYGYDSWSGGRIYSDLYFCSFELSIFCRSSGGASLIKDLSGG